MRYRDALAYLYGLEPRGIRLDLARMRRALALRGHPERACRFVHVAGTNGKGSVSAMIEACLRAGGFKTGLYTSPHLHSFGERVRVDGVPLQKREIARRVAELGRALAVEGAPELTFFETTTLMAFEAFRDAGCEVVVLEVGLGGRLDATNVVRPELSVITRIALDHQDRLGATLSKIAREKAGIVKRGVPLVSGVEDREAAAVIARTARERGAPLLRAGRDFSASRGAEGVTLRAGGSSLRGLSIGLEGEMQISNAAIAFAAVTALRSKGFALGVGAVRAGFEGVTWPGRLEELGGAPRTILDAAHNPDGMIALAKHLAGDRAKRRVLLFGAMADKSYAEMLEALDGVVDERVYVALPTRRAASPERFAAHRSGYTAPSITRGLAYARRRAGQRGLVVVAGSIMLVAEARARLLRLAHDPPIAM